MMSLDAVQAQLEAQNIRVIPRDSDNVSILCPFCPEHDPDTKGKCYVTPGKWNGIYRCFKCDSAGSIRSLFRHLGIPVAGSVLSMEQMAERIAKIKASRAFHRDAMPKKLEKTALPMEYIELEPGNKMGWLVKQALIWLNRRGIHWDQIQKWQIGYCPFGHHAQHLILPVFDESGGVATFQSRRFIGTTTPKSKNPKAKLNEMSKADVMYGEHRVEKGDNLVLVEGPFDVLYLERMFARLKMKRFKPLAILGHQISSVQAQTLHRFEPRSVWVIMDADAVKDGRKIGTKLARIVDGDVYITDLEYGDPDDLEATELLEKMNNSYKARSASGLEKKSPFKGDSQHKKGDIRQQSEGSV